MTSATRKRKRTRGFLQVPLYIVGEVNGTVALIAGALVTLVKFEGRSVGVDEVEDITGLEARRVQRGLEKLVAKGFAVRENDPSDGRRKVYQLRDKNDAQLRDKNDANREGPGEGDSPPAEDNCATNSSDNCATSLAEMRDKNDGHPGEHSFLPVVETPPGEEGAHADACDALPKGPAKVDPSIPPTALVERARELLEEGYKRRYKERFKEPFFGIRGNGPQKDLGPIAAYCTEGGAAEIASRVDACLDGYFARSDAAAKRQRWPLSYLAEDPGRYAAIGRGGSGGRQTGGSEGEDAFAAAAAEDAKRRAHA